jgi:predicted DNA-binding protein (MmcQ/YjbR family)
MNVDSVRGYCLSFPQARENLQWGETLCFKVAGRIFAMLSLDSVPPSLCFKCTPEKFMELVEQEGIRPAPYVGRYKWILLERLDVLRDEELEDLIRQSYEMVATKGKTKAKTKTKAKGRKVKVNVKGSKHRGHEGHEGKAGSSADN